MLKKIALLLAVAAAAGGVRAQEPLPLPDAKHAVHEAIRRSGANLATAREIKEDWAALLVLLPYGAEEIEPPQDESLGELRRYMKARAGFWSAVRDTLEKEARRLEEKQASLESLRAQIAVGVLARKAREIVADAKTDARFLETRDQPRPSETAGQVKARKIKLFESLHAVLEKDAIKEK